MRGYTAVLWRAFVDSLPWLVGIWVVGTVGVAAWDAVTGQRSLGESLVLAVTFLPVAIAITPMLWLRHSHEARTRRALPGIGLAAIWTVVTLPLAVLATIALADLLGVE